MMDRIKTSSRQISRLSCFYASDITDMVILKELKVRQPW